MRKNILLVLLTMFSIFTYAQEVKWLTMQEAITAQQRNKKPIFIDAYTVWCGPCKELDKSTFTNPEIIQVLNEKYNPVKFNAEGNEEIQFQGKIFKNSNYQEARKNTRNGMHEFAGFLKVRAYPDMIILDVNGKIVKEILGYRTPEQLLPEL